MKKLLTIYHLLLTIYYLLLTTHYSPLIADSGGAGADPLWGNFQKKIVVRSGKTIGAWDNEDERADVTLSQYGVRAATMTPVGDGTYQIRFYLTPYGYYNFAFFAVSTQPLSGISTGEIYYDAVPPTSPDKPITDMAIIISTTTESPMQNNLRDEIRDGFPAAGYITIGSDARRYIRVPDLPPGTTLYVYSNWASTPTAPTNFRAIPGDKRVELSWGPPFGYWGTGSESYKAIDVIAGGAYHIYRSSISPEGPYEIVATTPGYCFSWIDNSVTNGVRYYYAIVSSDTYKGSLAGLLGDVNLASAEPPPPGSIVTPGEAINIRFRVEGIDWEKVKENNYLVWLTPILSFSGEKESMQRKSQAISGEDVAAEFISANVWAEKFDIYSTKYKIPARIVEVKVPKTLKDRINDLIRWLGG